MGLTATVSPSADFPVFPVIWPTLLHRFLGGARTVSPVARHALVTVLPLTTPPEWQAASSARDLSCCLRPEPESSASGVIIFSRPPLGSLALRPGDSLAIPKMALSVGFIRFVSSTDATLTTGLLTLTLVGLIPTEHVCLVWTHVGSGTGAVTRRPLLVCIQGFPLRARVGGAVVPFPVPAASHAACGFAALRAPAPLRGKGYGAVRWSEAS